MATPKERKLTSKQLKFAEVFRGNAVQAARDAGYSGPYGTLAQAGHENLKNPKILEIIREREKIESKTEILDRQGRLALWSRMAVDPKLKPADRLKASELLAKANMDFVQKIEMSGNMQVQSQIQFYLPDNGRKIIEIVEEKEPVKELEEPIKELENKEIV